MLKKLSLMLCAGLITITGCANNSVSNNPTTSSRTQLKDYGIEQLRMPKESEEIAVMETSMGTIKMRLFPEEAPKAVENFKTLSQNGYYEGIIFHRVINDFMIQGGDPTGTGTGGESAFGEEFENEVSVNMHNFRGALAMANAGVDTNGSQFYIVQAKPETLSEDNLNEYGKINEQQGYEGLFEPNVIEAYKELGGAPHLDYGYTVFGQVFEGMDVVDKIAMVQTDGNDKPKKDVTIKKVEIVEHKD